jgi:hypothetical protein
MKSTKLIDWIKPQFDKTFVITGYENGFFFKRKFSLNVPFENETDNTSEIFNTLTEIVKELDAMLIGEMIFHDCIRDNDKSKCVIKRIK